MDPKDREKTAFTCHRGLYQFKVMPFGLSNAPAVFSELMSKVLRGCEADCVHYIDDILIFSDTLEQHFHHLQTGLDRIRAHGLKLKLKKCSFLQKETSFLGFRVSNKGVKAEESRIEAIRSLSPPASVREVESEVDVPDATYRVEVLNSNQFEPKSYAAYEAKIEETDLKDLLELDMKTGQGKDSDIQVILEKLKHEEAKSDPKFVIHEEVLYYLSNPDDDPILRFFIDNLTGYPEAFAIPDKSAETMVSLLLNDVFPRIGCPLVLVTDNGTENVNKIMQETLKELKIHHVKTSTIHNLTHV
ncbi:Gag-Pol polyprotein [Plakobranchus ocellatus]|uniref:Gag-Pol polyprotein n=1 Tax=Plakobranchus ocellatus TaxID=259542 RepID=A0AAV3XTX0_9GAST|nr:Gag-Pol polyprotein [Plakobranchus ocellatus]